VSIFGAALVLALAFAVSLITSTTVASRAYQARARQTARLDQEITVKGSTRQRVTSDLAVWHITIRAEAPALADAFSSLDAATTKVRGFLVDKGFADPEVHEGAIDTATFYAHDDKGVQTRQISGFALDRLFTVTTADVGRVAAAAGQVTQLLRDGVQVASARPEYYYSKAADLKVQLLGAATKDARARADEIAKNSGCRVAEVHKAQMGVIQITQPNSTDVSGSGLYDTSTIEKDVSVVVTLSLGLES
jgi:hypothetical protein